MNNVLKVLDEHPRRQDAERYDRVFIKAIKFGAVEGDIIGYCASCDKWYNQTQLGSPMCPKHGRFLSKHRRL